MNIQDYIYLCRNYRNGYTKIGFSKHPAFREKTLQSEEPEVSFIAIFPGDPTIERELHERFQEKRLRGEWFDLSADDVDNIVCDYAQIDDVEWYQFRDTWHDLNDSCIEGTPLVPGDISFVF